MYKMQASIKRRPWRERGFFGGDTKTEEISAVGKQPLLSTVIQPLLCHLCQTVSQLLISPLSDCVTTTYVTFVRLCHNHLFITALSKIKDRKSGVSSHWRENWCERWEQGGKQTNPDHKRQKWQNWHQWNSGQRGSWGSSTCSCCSSWG